MNWEVADIGIIVRYRTPESVFMRKVALLQSKRLHPTNRRLPDETRSDFEVGFARLDDPEDDRESLGREREFQFKEQSRYREIEHGSDQIEAIDAYEAARHLHVYYQLYNPWEIPLKRTVPLVRYKPPSGNPPLGVRIARASAVHALLSQTNRIPQLSDLASLSDAPRYGWRLEVFIRDLLRCRQGDVVTKDDDRLSALFYRRSGPIAAAISISVEAPDQRHIESVLGQLG